MIHPYTRKLMTAAATGKSKNELSALAYRFARQILSAIVDSTLPLKTGDAEKDKAREAATTKYRPEIFERLAELFDTHNEGDSLDALWDNIDLMVERIVNGEV